MKSLFLVFSLVAGAIAADLLMADTGWEGAVRIEVGSYAETRKVTVSSSTIATLTAASKSRPDVACFNNTPYTLWIGSAAAGVTLPDNGFPILSSATFRIGALTGSVSGLLDTAAGSYSGDVRCFDGLVR